MFLNGFKALLKQALCFVWPTRQEANLFSAVKVETLMTHFVVFEKLVQVHGIDSVSSTLGRDVPGKSVPAPQRDARPASRLFRVRYARNCQACGQRDSGLRTPSLCL
eukprot:IDg20379t1